MIIFLTLSRSNAKTSNNANFLNWNTLEDRNQICLLDANEYKQFIALQHFPQPNGVRQQCKVCTRRSWHTWGWSTMQGNWGWRLPDHGLFWTGRREPVVLLAKHVYPGHADNWRHLGQAVLVDQRGTRPHIERNEEGLEPPPAIVLVRLLWAKSRNYH